MLAGPDRMNVAIIDLTVDSPACSSIDGEFAINLEDDGLTLQACANSRDPVGLKPESSASRLPHAQPGGAPQTGTPQSTPSQRDTDSDWEDQEIAAGQAGLQSTGNLIQADGSTRGAGPSLPAGNAGAPLPPGIEHILKITPRRRRGQVQYIATCGKRAHYQKKVLNSWRAAVKYFLQHSKCREEWWPFTRWQGEEYNDYCQRLRKTFTFSRTPLPGARMKTVRWRVSGKARAPVTSSSSSAEESSPADKSSLADEEYSPSAPMADEPSPTPGADEPSSHPRADEPLPTLVADKPSATSEANQPVLVSPVRRSDRTRRLPPGLAQMHFWGAKGKRSRLEVSPPRRLPAKRRRLGPADLSEAARQPSAPVTNPRDGAALIAPAGSDRAPSLAPAAAMDPTTSRPSLPGMLMHGSQSSPAGVEDGTARERQDPQNSHPSPSGVAPSAVLTDGAQKAPPVATPGSLPPPPEAASSDTAEGLAPIPEQDPDQPCAAVPRHSSPSSCAIAASFLRPGVALSGEMTAFFRGRKHASSGSSKKSPPRGILQPEVAECKSAGSDAMQRMPGGASGLSNAEEVQGDARNPEVAGRTEQAAVAILPSSKAGSSVPVASLESLHRSAEVAALREQLSAAGREVATAGESVANAAAALEAIEVKLQEAREGAGFRMRHLEIDREEALAKVARLEARLAAVMQK